jgi:8-oxo-dGTP diphosphatase
MNPSPPHHRATRSGVVAVITHQERFLVIRRSHLVRAPRAVCFPGGGIEPGETESVALLRELQEELAAKARAICRLWESRSASGLHLAWWRAELEANCVLEANPAEVEAIHWWTAEELLRHPDLLPSNRAFLGALARREFSWDDTP